MSKNRTRWIHVEGWDTFQHYRKRRPPWIKNYMALLNDDAYLKLTMHQRGVLHGLWLAYSASNRQLSDNSSTLYRQLGQRVSRRDIEALNHAGFIRLSASKTLARCKQDAMPETEREKETTSLSPLPKPLSPNGRAEMPAGTAPPTADAAAPQPATGPRVWRPGDAPV